MKKLILGLAATAAVAVAAPGLASAGGPSDNPTTNDAYGYCIANHIANFNGDNHGIGHLRSAMTGQVISGSAGNRAPADPCVDTQGTFAPISNNG
jgi:hypothetical protein